MLYILFVSFLTIILCLFVILFGKNITLKEHLSYTAIIPKDLKTIKMGDNIFTDNAFKVLHLQKQGMPYRILYSYSNTEISTRFLILTNDNFDQTSNQNNVKVFYDSQYSKLLITQILSIIPNFKSKFGTYEISPNVIEPDKFMNNKYPIMYAFFLSTSTDPIVHTLNKYQLKNFDYISVINNNAKIYYLYPYAQISVVYLRTLFPKKVNLEALYKVLSFDKLIYTKDDLTNIDLVTTLKEYYSRKSKDTKMDLARLNLYEKLNYKTYSNKESIEEFTTAIHAKPITPNITLEPTINVRLKLISYQQFLIREFELDSHYVQSVLLKTNDTLILNNQNSKFENGIYTVFEHEENNTLRILTGITIQWLKPYITTKNINQQFKQTIIEIKMSHPDIQKYNNILKLGLNIYILDPINMYGTITTIEDTIVRVLLYNKELQYINDYICIGDNNAQIEQQCESKFDLDGNKKNKTNIWDRRCVSDTECPFFSINDGKYEGTCTANGYCQMPLGVKRSSFRKYEVSDESFPYCHGCTDILQMKECCETRKNKYGDNNLYVFTNE